MQTVPGSTCRISGTIRSPWQTRNMAECHSLIVRISDYSYDVEQILSAAKLMTI